MKGKRNNNNFEYEDQRQTFRLSPRQLRRDRINPKMRVALILHCLCGYSQSDAYAIAFNYRGSPNSLAPIASRFFNAPEVRVFAELFVRYYFATPYHVNSKYFGY